MNAVEMTEIANRHTVNRGSAEAAGFILCESRVTGSFARGNVALKGAYVCVCGRQVLYDLVIDEAVFHNGNRGALNDLLDPACHLGLNRCLHEEFSTC